MMMKKPRAAAVRTLRARADSLEPAPRIPKQAVSLRIDDEVVRWFRRHSARYQSHMNAVLRDYVRRREGMTK